MTINQAMMRGIRRAEPSDEGRLPWCEISVFLAVGLAAVCLAFYAGTWWHGRREAVVDREYNAWFERTANEAMEKAAKMTNAELLATERECASNK